MPTRTLAPITDRMFSRVPPYYRDSTFMQAFLDAMGREVQRIQDKADELRLQLYPQNADDTFGILSLLETIFGLPVAPTGVSLATRQALVHAYLAGRDLSSAIGWYAAMSSGLGSTLWSFEEGPDDNQVTIAIPFSTGTFTSVQVLKLARVLTPAHIEIIVIYDEGFVVGEGIVGEDRL